MNKMIPTFEEAMANAKAQLRTRTNPATRAHQIDSKAPISAKVERDIIAAKIDNLESEILLTEMQYDKTEYLYKK